MFEKTPLYAESWNVAFRQKSVGTILDESQEPFIVIKNNIRYWAADPFIIKHNNETFIFAELYDYILCRGVIGYCKIEEGKVSKWRPVIKEKYHLSYPCIIKDNGNWYMMPESSEGNELVIYEAVQFPDHWEKKKVIRKDIKFTDTTPLLSKKALTYDVKMPQNPQLLLIDLDGKCGDVRLDSNPLCSRPAGHVFMKNGDLIRPAQFSEDCESGYGKGIVFYKCQFDEDNRYNEEIIKTIKPEELEYNWPIYLDGMHTYNAIEDYEVIDIKTRRFNFINLFMRVLSKFWRKRRG